MKISILVTKKLSKNVSSYCRSQAKHQDSDHYRHVDGCLLFPPKYGRQILAGNCILQVVVVTTNSKEDSDVVHVWKNTMIKIKLILMPKTTCIKSGKIKPIKTATISQTVPVTGAATTASVEKKRSNKNNDHDFIFINSKLAFVMKSLLLLYYSLRVFSSSSRRTQNGHIFSVFTVTL